MIQRSRWLREASLFRESIQTLVGEPMIDPNIRKSHPIYNFMYVNLSLRPYMGFLKYTRSHSFYSRTIRFTYYPRVPRTLRHWTPGSS